MADPDCATEKRAGEMTFWDTPRRSRSSGRRLSRIRELEACARAGAIMIPNPPCPASQKKSSTAASNPTTGAPSDTNDRRPAQLCFIRRRSMVVWR